ncbi:MAG: hypothetical protein K6G22_00260 [Lachnospiraceae bacterium]|nr:hypothetical protein [Lachnospiraceae bacterium]
METIYSIKGVAAKIYSRYENYILPVFKFILTLITLLFVNSNIGFMNKLKNPAIVLIVALLGSFLPMNASVILITLIITAHLYELSLECAVIALFVFMIMFIIYFRFSPDDSAAVLLTPICFFLKIPYVIPVIMGLAGSPLSCISVACGVVTYYIIDYAKTNASSIGTGSSFELTNAISGFKTVINGMLKNDEMILMIAVLALTTVVIYIVKRLEVNHAWKIAIVGGSIIEIIILIGGNAVLDTSVSVGFALISVILSIIIGLIMEFFMFNVNYSKAENVQFQDDEYYYYVRALPKVYVDDEPDED